MEFRWFDQSMLGFRSLGLLQCNSCDAGVLVCLPGAYKSQCVIYEHSLYRICTMDMCDINLFISLTSCLPWIFVWAAFEFQILSEGSFSIISSFRTEAGIESGVALNNGVPGR